MNEEEVRVFVDKVKNCEGLQPPESELLDAILKVAADIKEENEPAFADEFAGAFTKKQADLVLEYVAESTQHHTQPATIFRISSEQPNDIIRKKGHDG